MKQIRKIALIMIFLLIFNSVFGISFYADGALLTKEDALNELKNEYVELGLSKFEQDKVDEFIYAYLNDNEFENHYLEKPQEAIKMVRDVIDWYLVLMNTPEPMWDHGNSWGADGVPVLKQPDYSSWCGWASAVQVITSLGGNVSGRSYVDKMATLARTYVGSADQNTSPYLYQIINGINGAVPQSQSYKYLDGSALSQDTLMTILKGNLQSGRPCILHTIPSYLTSYYPATATTGHYITVEQMRLTNGQYYLQLNDCHWRTEYNGRHTVTLEEAFNAIHIPSGMHIVFSI